MKNIKTILVIFILFIFVNANSQSIVIDKVIATVGSKIILDSDIQIQLLQMKARGTELENSECDIFEDQLFQKLLLNQAQLDSLEVTEAEVTAELNSRIETFIEQFGSQVAMEEYFNKSIYEIKDMFEDIIEDQLLTQRMQYSITEGITVTPAEVRDYYLSIDKDSLPLIDTKLEIQRLRIYPIVSDEEKQIAQEKIEGFRQKIIDGTKKFETIAIMYSEDSYSATKGGELGFMGRGELDPDFAAAAFTLEKDEISDVVESQFGLHIVQLIERRGEKVNCRHILISPKVSNSAKVAAKNRLDSIKNLVLIDSLTFEEAAYLFSEDKDSYKSGGNFINQYTGDTKFDIESIDPRIKYIVDKLAVDEISKPSETIDDSGISCFEIYKLKSRTEPHIANLEQDYQEIMSLALQKKQIKIVDEWIREKQRAVYVHIDDNYLNCNFKYKGWIK